MRGWRKIGAAVGVFFLLLSIVDVPDQLAKWGEVFSLLEGERGRWLVVLLGLIIIVIATFPELRGFVVHLVAGPPTSPVVAGVPGGAPAEVARPGESPRDREQARDDELPGEVPGEISVADLPPPAARAFAEMTRRRRIADLVVARVEKAGDLRAAFDDYMETFLARRAQYNEGMTGHQLEEARAEYGRLQRRAVRCYRDLREHYRRFLRDEPQFDRSSADPDDYVSAEPLPFWWEALTFDSALDRYANADDDHLRRYMTEERAILEAFTEWIAEPRHHDLAQDLEGANLEDEEIVGLVHRRLAERERQEQEAARRAQATLSARSGSISGGAQADQYNFEVMNTGPAAARRVRAWAAQEDGSPATGPTDLHTLPADSQWYPLRLDIPRQFSDAGGLRLVVSWEDDAGQQEAALLDIPRLR
jgi:hypothetical protein